MCTRAFTFDDKLISDASRRFGSEDTLNQWMQQQLEMMLLQVVAHSDSRPAGGLRLSQRLRGVAKAPVGFDYKKELETRF